ncbi:phospho-sugar mutase [Oceanivirga salmonicida]|uniref:phospho-sugar mutase n=1 Tax=Oceanivirga salmonicida TaxID=1769291 RepID=UPI000832CB01|nr:phospho-sugar mutase [Oceanivirga salmonicida]
MESMKKFEKWLEYKNLDKELKRQLEEIKGNTEEINDRFYQDLVFGTAGLRGKLGAGTNRMNYYVIARATRALAEVIIDEGQKAMDKGIAFAYDCRIMSPEFAQEAALIMASAGIKTYLFESLRPTPELSFAVRYLSCIAGVNITASHNPKEYNGYKVYWKEGSQIKDDIASKVLAKMEKLEYLADYKTLTLEEAVKSGKIIMIGEEIDRAYYENVKGESLNSDDELDKSVRIVYTPLHGAGNIAVRTMLAETGFENVFVVEEEEKPNGHFPTTPYPNPEFVEVFEYSNKLAKKVNADIIIATDPDADRLAIEVVHKGEIKSINGNQAGVLLINYLLSTLAKKNKMPKNPVIVKSIVTGDMGTAICKKYGVEMINVLTGFKNICALSNLYEETKEKTYVMGYEESVGYNVGTFVRDKDGVTSAVLFAEMAAYYKKQGKTLWDVLEELFKEVGYYKEKGISIVLEGIEGKNRIDRMMKEFRNIYPKNINGVKALETTDYLVGKTTNSETGIEKPIDIEKTNAFKVTYEDGSWYTLRPSGTEPKIKLYTYVKDEKESVSDKKLGNFIDTVLEVINGIK